MDCENLNKKSGLGGPLTWDESEKAILGFIKILEEIDFKATLFLCPEAARAHSDIISVIRKGGHELAMHFHPDSFREGKAKGKVQLGRYVGKKQYKMLSEGKKVWEEALGFSPLGFRPGCCSANDETFSILKKLGFHHGSVSSPGRKEASIGSIWEPSVLNVHFADPALRSVEGNGELDFVEVPITVDWEKRYPHRFGWSIPQELFIERGDLNTHIHTIKKNIERMKEEKPPILYLCVATHNVFNYADKNNEKRQILVGLIEKLGQLKRDYQIKIKGATIKEIAGAFRNQFKGN